MAGPEQVAAEPDFSAAGKGGKLTKRAYSHIRSEVVGGVRPTGSVLSAKTVAEELGISPTPVRQAIQLLLQEGMLEFGKRRQITVRGFQAEQLDEINHVREVLEKLAVAKACEVMTDDSVDHLRLLIIKQRRLAEAALDAEYDELDAQFHLAIASGAGLEIVHKFLTELGGFIRMSPIRRGARPRDSKTLHFVTDQHERIAEAIAARDVPKALAALDDNLHVGPTDGNQSKPARRRRRS